MPFLTAGPFAIFSFYGDISIAYRSKRSTQVLTPIPRRRHLPRAPWPGTPMNMTTRTETLVNEMLRYITEQDQSDLIRWIVLIAPLCRPREAQVFEPARRTGSTGTRAGSSVCLGPDLNQLEA
jgi:hypothetical protein